MSAALALAGTLPFMDDGLLESSTLDELIREIERYLALVALLRQAGYEPRWAVEPRHVAAACEMPVRAM